MFSTRIPMLENSSHAIASTRLHYLDWLKSLLMLLGVPYHAALLYADGTNWFIYSEAKSSVLTIVAALIHSFRMPAFFMISGMMSSMLLAKRGPAAWAKDRVNRIGVPLLVATLLISPLVVLSHRIFLRGGHWQPEIITEIGPILMQPGQHWVGHLWFLYVLLIYSSGLIGYHYMPPAVKSAVQNFSNICFANPYMLLASVIIYEFVVRTVTFLVERSTGFDFRLFGLLNTEALLVNLPFFALGAYISGKEFAHPFGGATWKIIAIMAALVGAYSFNEPDFESKLLWYMSSSVLSIIFSMMLINIFKRKLNIRSDTIQALSKSSYTIYLFHMPVLTLIGSYLVHSNTALFAQYVSLLTAGIAIPLLLHQALGHSPLLIYLFNGTRPKRDNASEVARVVMPQ
ncbi:acyltransferase family protein [Microvirga sp. 3-52]|nr:acyltransferase family protein [Microvirga sp. 3-52]